MYSTWCGFFRKQQLVGLFPSCSNDTLFALDMLSICSSLTVLVLLMILDMTELNGASLGGKAPGRKSALRRV